VASVSSASRGAWVVLDQATSSLTNLALSVLVLREVSPAAFGAFALTLTSYAVALGISRAVVGEPLVVRFTHVESSEWRRSTADATGLAIVLGLLGGAVLFVLSWLLPGSFGDALLPLGIVLPGLLLQDAWRYAFFAAGTPKRAFQNDLAWGIAQVGLLAWVISRGRPSVGTLIVAWGLSATIAALIGIVQSRVIPRPHHSIRWLSAQKDLGPRFLGELLLERSASQVMLFGIGAIAGLNTVGAIQAASVVLGPFRLVQMAAAGFGIPEGIRIWRSRPEGLVAAARALSIGLGLLAVAFGAATSFLPDSVGGRLLGATWPEARDLLFLTGIWLGALGVAEGARLGLRVLAASRRSLGARLVTAPAIVLGGTLGAAIGGARGAVIGLDVACCIEAFVWWRTFIAATRSAGHGPVTADDDHVDLATKDGGN